LLPKTPKPHNASVLNFKLNHSSICEECIRV